MDLKLELSGADIIPKGDDRLLSYSENPIYQGNPDGVLIARDFQDVSAILQECSSKKIPVTFSGSRTSMTGSSTTREGLIIAMEQKNKILDIGAHDNKIFA